MVEIKSMVREAWVLLQDGELLMANTPLPALTSSETSEEPDQVGRWAQLATTTGGRSGCISALGGLAGRSLL